MPATHLLHHTARAHVRDRRGAVEGIPPTRATRPVASLRDMSTPASRAALLAGALIVSLLLGLPALAAAKAAPDLRAVRAAAPTSAHAGGPLPVRLVVASTARLRRAAGVRVYLSKDRRRSRDDLRLAGAAKLGPMRAGRATVSVAATVPAGRTGTLRVIACADDPGRLRERRETNNCAAAPAAVAIAAQADPARTSAALIEADRAAGKLSAEKAILYRVYAVFGDERLPARYAGDAGGTPDEGVMRDVAGTWRSLSARKRRLIGPFTLRPSASTSWFSRLTDAPAKAAERGDENDPCSSEATTNPGWRNYATAAGGNVRIWGWHDEPGDKALAETVAGTVNAAWPIFKKLMGRTPISDTTEKLCPHGPDGALDVYFLDGIPRATALTIPSYMTRWADGDCQKTSSYIVMERSSRTFTRPFTIAHELFHAFQNAYSHKGGCFTDGWFDEDSANWAAHTVLPRDDSEHFFTRGLDEPRTPVDGMSYDGWPFVLWMEKTLGAQTVRKTYEQFEKQPGMEAVDAAIGGLRTHFLDFARQAWNQKPLDPAFAAWDRFPVTPQVDGHDVVQSHLFLAGQHERTANVPVALQAHARDYRSFTVTDDKVRLLTFRNPLAGDPDARVGAILTLRSGATRFEDWSGKDSVRMCRDQPDQDVADLVIVYAAADRRHENGKRMDGNPTLGLKDDCETGLPWHFKVLNVNFTSLADGAKPGSATTFCGLVAGRPIHGITDFQGGSSTAEFDPDNVIKLGYGGALEGDISVRAPASFTYTLTGCDDEKQYCSTAFTRPMGGDGMAPFGFALRAASRTAQDATLTWSIADPDVGFVDYGPEVCNVSTIWKALKLTDQQQTVPLATFEDLKPFTLHFQGSGSWNTDQLGEPAVISYGWTYDMTLQRVDEQGRPLE